VSRNNFSPDRSLFF